MSRKTDQLKGNALKAYIEKNRDKFDGNGDALCLAAGYGINTDDGSLKCNLPSFINELGKAMHLSNPSEDLL
tara:strand:- start:945 stop:1160 length:216 start_codon:yes stop_codon:yes gene_type:complete